MPERDEVLGQVADVDLDPAGHVPASTGRRCRSSRPTPHRRRSSSHRPAAACASPPGARRCPSPSTSARPCVTAATRSRGCPSGSGTGDLLVDVDAPAVALEGDDGREQRGARSARASSGRARGHPGRRAEERRPRRRSAVRSRSASSADDPARLRTRSPGCANVAVAAGEREDLHAERLAEGEEAAEQRLGLQPLGDRGERMPDAWRPRRRRGPSCPCGGSAMTTPAAGARGVAHVRRPVVTRCAPDDLVARHVRQPEDLAPVAQVASACPPATSSRSAGRREAPGITRPGCASRLRTPRPAAPRLVGERAEGRGGERARAAACTHRQPSREPAATAWSVTDGSAHLGRPVCRRTLRRTRWTTGDSAQGPPRAATAGGQHVGHAEPGEAAADQHDDQPLGPLGDADVTGQARAPRPGPWRRRPRHPPTRQTSATPASSGSSPSPGELEHQPAEDRRVGDPVERGVEEGAPGAGRAPPSRAIDPVEHVGEDERGDHQRAPRGARPAGRRPGRRPPRRACRRR